MDTRDKGKVVPAYAATPLQTPVLAEKWDGAPGGEGSGVTVGEGIGAHEENPNHPARRRAPALQKQGAGRWH